MKLRRGPRPWPVVVFCLATLTSGTFDFVLMLSERPIWRADLEISLPMVEWNDDLVIVMASAIFSIVIIPLVAIWFFASRIARIFVTVMALLFTLPLVVLAVLLGFESRADLVSFALGALSSGSAALLWLPQAESWFRKEESVEPAVFD